MLVFVRSFSYTPHASLMRSFSYTPHASFSAAKAEVGDNRLYSATVSLTLLMLVLVRCFSYIPLAGFSEEFVLHSCSF